MALTATATTGANAYGKVPGQVTNVDPAELYKNLYPGLQADLGQAQSNISNQLKGVLPDDVSRSVWDKRAAMAAGGGVGGSNFTGANTARDLGLTSLGLQQQGGQNLNSLLSTLYPTAVAPTVDLTQTNAELGAAPDPEKAALEQQRVFNQQQQTQFSNQLALLNAQMRAQSAAAQPQKREYSSSTVSPTGQVNYLYKYFA